jgi:lactate dehydrogenase-like 2-hydroxyacid dehydrogenase
MSQSGRPRILVPQPIREEGLAMLRAVGDVEVIDTDRMLSRVETAAALQRCDYLVAIGDLPLDAELLSANPRLKGISVAARRPDEWMDVKAATALGIPVTCIASEPGDLGPVSVTTAEVTMSLLLGLAWRLIEADRWTRCGKFRQEQSTGFMCHKVSGKTLGLIGLGKVGRLVAERSRGFGLKLIYTKRTRLEAKDETALGLEWVDSLDDLLRRSDFVSLHAGYDASTHKLIGRREFELMKPTAFFINTARGRIVDEEALIEVLREGRIAGAGLDVYWDEPPVVPTPNPNPALFKLDNVILTPHIGGQTEESLTEIATRTAANIVALIKGERPAGLVNPEVLTRRA